MEELKSLLDRYNGENSDEVIREIYKIIGKQVGDIIEYLGKIREEF